MKTVECEMQTMDRAPITRWTVFRGLLWREWLLYRYSLSWMLAVWLIGVWILVLFNHPLWVVIIGSVFAETLAASMGTGDVTDGSEEFTFSLPVARRDVYLARVLLGLGSVLAFCVSSVLLMFLDVPQSVWSVLVETGFTEPLSHEYAPLWVYALGVLLPAALFSMTFWNASLCRTARAAAGSIGVSLMFVFLIGSVATWIEYKIWGELRGLVICSASAGLAVLPLWAGYIGFRAKEVGGE